MSIYKQLAAIASIATIALTSPEAMNAATNSTVIPETGRSQILEGDTIIAQRVVTRTYDGNGTLVWTDIRGYHNETLDKVSLVTNQSRQVTLILHSRNGGQFKIEGRIGLASDEGFRLVLENVEGTEAEGKLFLGRDGEVRTIEPLTVGSDNQDFYIGFQPSDRTTPDTDRRMTLSQEGRGLFSLAGKPNESLTRVSLVVAGNQEVQISMRGNNNALMRLQGKLIRRTDNTLNIQLINSEIANTRGSIEVVYGANNSIDTLTGDGAIDNQSFSIRFKGDGRQTGERSPLYLSQDGRGVLALAGRESRSLTRASAIVQPDGNVELAFRDSNNRSLRFSGRLVRRNANTLDIHLTASSNANATGTLNVSYGTNRRIYSLKGNGTLDGQRFSITFNDSQASTPNSLNLFQNGSGLFSIAGRDGLTLTHASAIVQGDGDVEMALRDRQNRSFRFSGKLLRHDTDTLEIKLTHAGNVDATGIVNLEYGDRNSINTLFADGTLNGQAFFINFSH